MFKKSKKERAVSRKRAFPHSHTDGSSGYNRGGKWPSAARASSSAHRTNKYIKNSQSSHDLFPLLFPSVIAMLVCECVQVTGTSVGCSICI
jgi:hypothetical protein